MMKKSTLTALIVALAAGTSQAAPINWGAAQDTTASAANDIINGGTVVLALNGHNFANDADGPADVTLDGVTFLGESFLGNNQEAGNLLEENTTGDADYDVLLNNAAIADLTGPNISGAANNDIVYTFGGLTASTDYLIQVWYTEERDDAFDGALIGREQTLGDDGQSGSTVVIAGQGANGFGQFAVGSFTADAATQDLSVVTNGFGRSHITAILVREVPEPSSLALLGLGSLLVARRRHA